MKITSSFRVVEGVKTNRIKRTTKQGSPKPPPKRFRRNGSGWGEKKPQRSVCINIPLDELEVADELASRAQMSRSHLVRQALRYFRAYLDDPSKHHQQETDATPR